MENPNKTTSWSAALHHPLHPQGGPLLPLAGHSCFAPLWLCFHGRACVGTRHRSTHRAGAGGLLPKLQREEVELQVLFDPPTLSFSTSAGLQVHAPAVLCASSIMAQYQRLLVPVNSYLWKFCHKAVLSKYRDKRMWCSLVLDCSVIKYRTNSPGPCYGFPNPDPGPGTEGPGSLTSRWCKSSLTFPLLSSFSVPVPKQLPNFCPIS